jgi:hypothetical protein
MMANCVQCKQPLNKLSTSLWESIFVWYGGVLEKDRDSNLAKKIGAKLKHKAPWCLPECGEQHHLLSDDIHFPPLLWIYYKAIEWQQEEICTRIRERGRNPLEFLIENHYSSIAEGRCEGLHFWAKMQTICEWYWDVDCGPDDNLDDDDYYWILISKPQPSDFTNDERRVLQQYWYAYKQQALYEMQMKGELSNDDDY